MGARKEAWKSTAPLGFGRKSWATSRVVGGEEEAESPIRRLRPGVLTRRMSSFHLSLGIGELHIRPSPPPNVHPISVIFFSPCPDLAREAAMKTRGSA